jgi:hypothetical protein
MTEVKITVVNKHKMGPAGTAPRIYIGRGSPLGNPFTHMKGTKAEFIVATREEAVFQYNIWLRQTISEGNIDALLLLHTIANQAVKPEGVELVCYCAPKACHGDVIKDILSIGIPKILEEKERAAQST